MKKETHTEYVQRAVREYLEKTPPPRVVIIGRPSRLWAKIKDFLFKPKGTIVQ